MQYPNLFHHSVFTIPVEGENVLLYAPLTGYVMKSDREYANRLEEASKNGTNNKKTAEQLERMLNTELHGIKMYQVQNPEEYLLLYILPNYICNFSCSYCFSAKGRSKKELSKENLKTALEYFIDTNRIKEKKLFITFMGGGEPTMSWKLLRFGIEYAYTLAQAQNIEIKLEIVTNGSILSEEMLQTFIKHKVQLRISFEVLEDIQNKQRGKYNKVCKTIDRLSEAGLYLEIRSMITPLNVRRMKEMVQTLITRFPAINYYMFDPITDKHTFHNKQEAVSFYKEYEYHFIEALNLAEQHQKQLKCATLRNLNSIVKRYCFGELCLTPEGTFTICHRVSSPSDTYYNDCIYGKITEDGKVEFNNEKYQDIINSDTVYNNPDCDTCFIKWNCGGGCMVQNKEYNDEIRSVICESTRDLSKSLLLRRLER